MSIFQKTNKLSYLYCLSILLSSCICNADLMVQDVEWPCDLPQSLNSKTNANNETNDVNSNLVEYENYAQELKSRKRLGYNNYKMVPSYHRLYLLGGANFFDSEIVSIKNNSVGPLQGGTLVYNKATNSRLGFELGLGYTWQSWRTDFTYFYNKKIHFNPSQLFVGRNEVLRSTTRSRGIQAGAYMDFDNYYYFRPFFGVLMGVNANRTKATLSGGVGDNSETAINKFALSFGLSFGARARFWSRWMGQIGYRHLFLGNVKWRDGTDLLRMTGKYWHKRVHADLIYIL